MIGMVIVVFLGLKVGYKLNVLFIGYGGWILG